MISDDEYLKRCIAKLKNNAYISDNVLEFFESPRPKYIYGADIQAAVCLGIFRDMKLQIEGIVLDPSAQKSRLKGYWGELLGKCQLYRTFEMVSKGNCDLLMTIDRSMYEESAKKLKLEGFEHIYGCEWGSNTNIKDACLSVYMEEYMQ